MILKKRIILFCMVFMLLYSFVSTGFLHSAIEKEPYLIYTGSNTEMKVCWHTDSSAGDTLEWGLTTSYSEGSISSSPQTDTYYYQYTHIETITGLTPGTKYYYRVTVGSSSYTGSFRTGPANDAMNLKFIAYGDTRNNPDDQSKVTGQIISTYTADPDFQTICLFAGDFTDSDTTSAWTNEWFNRSYSNTMQVFSEIAWGGARGNHETYENNMPKYYRFPYYNSTFYYAYEYGPALFIFLDTETSISSGSAQYNWLESQLQATSKKWIFITCHEPGYEAGSHSPNADIRDHVQPLCTQYGVDVVFAGHNHHYVRIDKNGIQHITTGGGGAPLGSVGSPNSGTLISSASTWHHMEITIEGADLTVVARRYDGVIIDTYTKHDDSIGTGPPVADFSADSTNGAVPFTVNFTDQSSNADSWSWDFGDGGTSNLQNPSHTYNSAGNYTVTLTATNANGNDTETKTDYITAYVPQPPVADFYAVNTTVEVGENVELVDTSTNNPTSWSWSFPGATPSTSTAQNPNISYSTPGVYDVSLTAGNSAGSDTETKTGYITVTAAPSRVGNTTIFTQTTTSANRRAMPFTMPEDGTISSIAQHHQGGSGNMILGVYEGESAPTNRLALTSTSAVSGSSGWQTVNLTSPVFVESGKKIWLAWVYESTPGIAYQSGTPGRVDAGVGWSGGMPSTFGTSTTASYIYSIYANYTPGGGTVNPPVADFSGTPTTLNEGQNVTFSDLSTNNPTSWSWSFPGGTPASSTSQNPSVTYNTEGTYDVTLTVSNSAGSDSETKNAYITVEAGTVTYCSASGNDYSYEWIANVEVGNLNHASGASGYSDFTSQTANLTAGGNVAVSLTPGFASTTYNEYWAIWIDYNTDGDFDDSGEKVFTGSGSSTVTGNFTVPSSAGGVNTTMRVIMNYNESPSPCGTFNYGEVEDYSVSIGAGGTMYTLTTSVTGQGTVSPASGTYAQGTVVNIQATPAANYVFDSWSGDLSGNTNPTTITMDSNKNITANFTSSSGGTYVSFTIDSSNADAEERVSTGDMNLTSTDLELVDESGDTAKRQLVGLHFTGLTIPKGANITDAYIQFTCDNTNTGATNLTIRAHDADNSGIFTTSTGNISSRSTTTAYQTWSPPSWTVVGEAGTAQRTPNISGLIQEVIDRLGYSQGNPITIIITGSGEREAESYDGTAAPVLYVKWD